MEVAREHIPVIPSPHLIHGISTTYPSYVWFIDGLYYVYACICIYIYRYIYIGGSYRPLSELEAHPNALNHQLLALALTFFGG